MTAKTTTLHLGDTPADIAQAADILARGGLVAFPTETVYGLGADATDDRAVARIFEAKERPSFNPLIAHVANVNAARELVEFSAEATRLATAFWPGALTLVLPLKAGATISKLVTAGGAHLAVRVPDGRIAQALLAHANRPIAAPSANPSGRLSPTKPAHVSAGLEGRIDAILDGGSCPVGVESTIIGFDPVPRLLRAGGIPVEAVEAVLGSAILREAETGNLTAPGQLASHYAPKARVRRNATEAKDGEILIGFKDVRGRLMLSETGDLVEAAARLFDILHTADATGAPIAVAPIPETGLGQAINDRLRRAAAPRP